MIALVFAVLQTLTGPGAPAPHPQQVPTAPPQAAQQPLPTQAPAEPAPNEVAAPYEGTLRAGRLELAKLSKLDKPDDARALCSRLESKLAAENAPEGEQAETLYAIGVAQQRAGWVEEAVDAFHRCRGLAGSSELGLDAIYNSGTAMLTVAEDLRLAIPEVREKLKLPAQPAAPQPPGGGQQQATDPLEVARGAYLASRAELVERWKGGHGDQDTRANLELIQRRLRELDELKKQREEQKQQQEQEQQDQEQDQKQDQQEQDPSKQDPKSQDEQGQDPKDQQKQQDQPKDEPKDGQEDKPKSADEQKDQPQEPPPESGADQAKPREQMVLTPEEMQRLMDQLAQIEERAQQVQAMLRERRKTPVKKDW